MYPMNVSQNVGGQAAHVLRTNERCPGKTGLKSAAGVEMEILSLSMACVRNWLSV